MKILELSEFDAFCSITVRTGGASDRAAAGGRIKSVVTLPEAPRVRTVTFDE